MKTLRLAVVGAGHLGRIHARIAREQDAVELAAVADPCESARRLVAEQTGVRTVADYRALIEGASQQADVGPIDAAIVATPTTSHHQVAGRLLDAGVPVLVEKPMAATYAEAADLVERAARANLVLQVGHVERYNPALATAAPHLADPKYIVAERCSGYPGRSLDIGVVLDLMIHDIDVVLSLVRSPVKRVDALGISILGGNEDMANARIVFECGCVASLTASRASYERRRSMQVYSARAFAALDFDAGTATLVRPSETVLRRQLNAATLCAAAIGDLQQRLFDDVLVREQVTSPAVNAIEEEQREFYRCIRTGDRPQVDGAAGRDALAVAEFVLGAINAHEWDGSDSGRSGPFAMPALPVLRPAA